MESGQLTKAWFKNLDNSEEVRVLFNPTEYTINKTNNWKVSPDTGSNIGKIEFTGGNPIELKMKLQFDTSLSGKNVQEEHTKKLWALSMVNTAKKDPKTKKSRPPRCEFHWGGGWSFEAVVTTISEQLTMFLPDGTPIRSQVDITLKQAKDPGKFPFQNPTSGGVPGHRTHVVRESETLDWIASSEYGEARHWRYIAEQNNLDNPMQVTPGTILQLPPLPVE
jgi:hypothetical protein